MNKWEAEVQKSLLDSEEAALKELEKQYAKALQDIGEKVKSFQADIDLLDEALSQDGLDDTAKARMLSMKRSKIYQQQYQQALQGQVSAILDKMHGDNYATIDGYLHDCYNDGYIGTMYDIAGQGIPLVIPIDQAAAVKAVLTDSKVSGGLYNALGVDVGKLKKKITQEISRGIASSLPYRDIARNIASASGAPLNRAKVIARTEGHRIQQTGAANAQAAAKAKGADVLKQWDATLDARTRESHALVDGELRALEEPFSNGLMFPGDPDGGASEVVNCRCVANTRARWALDEAELQTLKERAEYFGLDKTESFEEFEKKYIVASQETQTIQNHGITGLITAKAPGKKNIYGFNQISGNRTLDDDIVLNGKPTCNPNYGKDPAYSINCQRCVQAFEFRRRGFDVIAKPKPKTNNTILWGSECFTDNNGNPVKYMFRQSAAQVKKEISNAPDGARYGVYVVWKGRNNGAHVFVAEKQNGVVRYLDPQVGNTDASGYFANGKPGQFGLFRMDDKELTKDVSIVTATMEGV